MRSPKVYFVYIMTNRSKTLYTGVTNNLVRRVREHKLGIGSGSGAKYRLDRLVYIVWFTLSVSKTCTTRSSVKKLSKAGCGSRKLP